MAYSNENICVVYNGDDNQLTFAISFDYVEDTSVMAELWDVSDPLNPIKQPITTPADWIVDSGNVVLQVPPTSDEKLLLFRETTPTHGTEYSTYEFPFATMNLDLDTVYQIAQENRDALNRAIVNSQFDACSGGGGTIYTIDDIRANTEAIEEIGSADYQTQIDANTAGVSSNVTGIANNALLLQDHEDRLGVLESASGVYDLIVVSAAGNVVAENANRLVVKSAGVTIDLPSIPVAKDEIIVKNRGSNIIAVSGNGNTVDGAASHTIVSNESSFTYLYDGSEWIIL